MKKIVPVLLVLSTLSATAQKFKPELHLTEGKKYIVTNSVKGSMAQEVMGQSMEIPMDATITNLLEVKKAESKSFDLSNTVTHIVFNISMMGNDTHYDSDKKEDQDSEAGKQMGDMLGKPVLFKVNSFGKTIEGSIIKKGSPEKPAAGGNMFAGMMNINDSNATSQAIDLFLTDETRKIGDSFTDSSTSANGKDKKSTTYTFTAIKDGMAQFLITGNDSATNEMELQGMQTISTTATKTTGEMWVNTATGLLAKKTLNMVISGTVEVMGMSIPISGTNAITITVTEADK